VGARFSHGKESICAPDKQNWRALVNCSGKFAVPQTCFRQSHCVNEAYTDGMANLPELIVTERKAGQPVAFKCSVCEAAFVGYESLPSVEDKARALHEQFNEHVKKMHSKAG
jgi:hypothetical protein